MSHPSTIYTAVIVIYLLILIGVSVVKSRKVKTQEDFMVAGRNVSTAFLVGTLVCTWIGSGSLFGGAGRAFRGGFSALWLSAGAWLGIVIVYFLAGRVRRISQYTVPDILEMRYTPAARLLGTTAIIIAYLTIASYQFIGGGKLLNILTGLDPVYGQAITCCLVALYTLLAGMVSIVTLDLLNGILITGSVLLAAPFVLKAAGGWSGLTATLPASHFSALGSFGLASALGLFFPTFFLLLGESSMYQKFMSAKDERSARRAVIGMILGVIVVETVLDATAIFGSALYWHDPAFVHPGGGFNVAATETIILQVARFNLPLLLGVLLLAGGIAIIFSTANTFLMIPSTNLTRDIFQRFINPNASEASLVRFQRWSIIGFALLAFITSSFFQSILSMALYAYTMVGAAITPALLAAFLWKRVTPAAGTLSIAAGMVVTVIYAVLENLGLSSLGFDYIIYPAAAASLLSLIIASFISRPSDPAKWRPFWSQSS